LLPAARAWVSDVNARGGLNGHPVKLITGDDGGDPNRALSLARRMVDEDKVAAFYIERLPTTMTAVAPFLEQRKVPMIGSCNCTDAASRSPMVFEVGAGGGAGFAWSHLGPLVGMSDKRKVSLFYCREVATCSTIRNNVRKLVGAAGVEIVNEAQVTLTQPDYTAEVLAARNAGAEAILLAVDGFSSIRVMKSARRQNYNPVFSMQHGAHDARFPPAGGADVEGALISSQFPHWDSPKMADYRTAMAKYYPGAVLGSLSQTSWVTGKLMERIAKDFGDSVTSQDFVRGLYALQGETLGGIIPPLTYIPGKGSEENSLCVVPTRLEKGKFVTKNGDEYLCVPGWKPAQR
jgi:branched-chain amino acid transport system substrate-binding protein